MLDQAAEVRSSKSRSKLYFRIARSVGCSIKPYVLRFWETEFSTLARRNRARATVCTGAKDVELVLEIKHLLYDKRFTIEALESTSTNAPATSSKVPKPPQKNQREYKAIFLTIPRRCSVRSAKD